MAINRNKTYNIGELRQQVKVQIYTTTSDGMGGTEGAWSDPTEALYKTYTFGLYGLGLYASTPYSGSNSLQRYRRIDTNKIWADIKPLSGREVLEFGAIHGNVSHRVTLRYLPNISNENRIVYGKRVFNIKYALNLGEDSKLLELLATEEVTHGDDN